MKLHITGMPKRIEAALKAVVVAKAAWEAADAIDKETKAEILQGSVFVEEDTGNRITAINADFLMNEPDFTRYCELVYARNCEKGLDSGGAGLTLWPIQKAMYDAEDEYIDAVTADIPEYTPDVVNRLKASPERRKQFFGIIGL